MVSFGAREWLRPDGLLIQDLKSRLMSRWRQRFLGAGALPMMRQGCRAQARLRSRSGRSCRTGVGTMIGLSSRQRLRGSRLVVLGAELFDLRFQRGDFLTEGTSP